MTHAQRIVLVNFFFPEEHCHPQLDWGSTITYFLNLKNLILKLACFVLISNF